MSRKKPSQIEMPHESAIRVLAQQFKNLDKTALEVFILLTKTAKKIDDHLDVQFQRFGVARNRFMILGILFSSETRTRMPSELAERCGVTRATITGLLDTLEKDGLVQRVTGKDRRSLEIGLTDKGIRLVRKILPHHFETVETLMDGITESDRRSITNAIKKINLNLQQTDPKRVARNRRAAR